MVSKRYALTGIFMLCTALTFGQFRLPSFDISIKPVYLGVTDAYRTNGRDQNFMYESMGLQGEIHLQISQQLAIGWVYNRSAYANYHEKDSGGGSVVDKDGQHLYYGLDLRLSGGRASKYRPYIQGKYYWMEIVVNQTGYRTAAAWNGVAGGLGLMRRVNNKLYINLIEVEVNMIMPSDAVMFQRDDVFPQFRAGLTYNFSKRK